MIDYRFHVVWSIDAPVPRVADALTDLAGYPSWWPDVRAVCRVDDDTAEVRCRSALPYELRLWLRRVEQRVERDHRRGRLRVALTGDLEGFVGCVLTGRPGGTRLDIVQQVVVRKPVLRWLSPLARPLFRANHAVMMRRGRHGLSAHLTARPG
ncbi:Polyketide cyclase / dehydrase and lipid transport [Amycolatopsis arida]|uniref:Polyketide cyclase / dehydrase and lipid transport n=1 Tax=Amycolatopsis arida TaxID=587909 RepID=A0A1I6AGK1_9PSEU|nr:polyketide cyclase/dehydrase/lipid transport protein [Amycolatopsis arida]SFQ67772.1 Polyketide cyclase / dehydrase and lipid transport [Amycolatopsis arida]